MVNGKLYDRNKQKTVTMFALHMHIAWTFYILSIYMYALFHHFNKNIVSYLP